MAIALLLGGLRAARRMEVNAEGVRNSSPGWLWQPWVKASHFPKELHGVMVRKMANNLRAFCTQGFKANSGLTLANAFSVTRYLEVQDLVRGLCAYSSWGSGK